MKNLIILIFCLAFAGCSKKAMQSSERRDSVRVEHRVEYIEKVRDTTIYISLPAEVKEVVRWDSSFLETSIAESFARIEADGNLFHTLRNKERQLEARAQVKDTEKSEQRDSVRIVYQEKLEIRREKFVPSFYRWCAIFALLSLAYFIWRGAKFLKKRL